MEAWIVYYKDSAEYNKKYIELYIEEGKKLGIDFRLVLIEDIKFGVKDGKLFFGNSSGEDLCLPDFVVVRAIYPLLSKHLELMGVPVYNNSFVSEICNDKAKTCQYLAKTGIPMADTFFYKNFQVNNQLDIQAPTVIKAVDGHGGSQVFLVENCIAYKVRAKELTEGIGSSDVVIQPLVGTIFQDLRVYVIGKEIIAAVLRTSKEGFRANYSLGGDVQLYNLNEDEKRLVRTIINEFEFGLVGIDFLIDDNGELIFNEIEDVVGSRMLYKCSDINIVELYLKFIIEDLKEKKGYTRKRENIER